MLIFKIIFLSRLNSEGSEKTISKKFQGIDINRVYGIYLRATDKPILDSQTKFKEVSNKIVKEIL